MTKVKSAFCLHHPSKSSSTRGMQFFAQCQLQFLRVLVMLRAFLQPNGPSYLFFIHFNFSLRNVFEIANKDELIESTTVSGHLNSLLIPQASKSGSWPGRKSVRIQTFILIFRPHLYCILIGLQYAYLNSDADRKEDNEQKGSRSEITLDELDDLYKSEEAEKEAELASKRLMMASHSNLVTSIKVNSSTPPPVVRMRSRDDLRGGNGLYKASKKINRLSRKSTNSCTLALLDLFCPVLGSDE